MAKHDLNTLQVLVQRAARALGRAGLAHAYGHCSARIDNGSFLVCASKPMGLVAPGDTGVVVSIDGPLPEGVLGEVRIHQQIYARRKEVRGICRAMPPSVMSLSAMRKTPRPLHGMGAYFAADGAGGPPLWDDPQLVRSDAAAAALADQLGAAPAIVMRGNGAVVVADSLEKAVSLMWYLEDAARIDLAVLACGSSADAAVLSSEEAVRRATDKGGIFERMWEYLTAGDPE